MCTFSSACTYNGLCNFSRPLCRRWLRIINPVQIKSGTYILYRERAMKRPK